MTSQLDSINQEVEQSEEEIRFLLTEENRFLLTALDDLFQTTAMLRLDLKALLDILPLEEYPARIIKRDIDRADDSLSLARSVIEKSKVESRAREWKKKMREWKEKEGGNSE